MIALDTNILLRIVLRDDPIQSPAAKALIEAKCSPASPAFVSLAVTLEFAWTLARKLKIPRGEFATELRRLLRRADCVFDEADLIEAALDRFEIGAADFADHLIAEIGMARGADTTFTFDTVAASENGFTLLRA